MEMEGGRRARATGTHAASAAASAAAARAFIPAMARSRSLLMFAVTYTGGRVVFTGVLVAHRARGDRDRTESVERTSAAYVCPLGAGNSGYVLEGLGGRGETAA
jgi:hypothetical protein